MVKNPFPKCKIKAVFCSLERALVKVCKYLINFNPVPSFPIGHCIIGAGRCNSKSAFIYSSYKMSGKALKMAGSFYRLFYQHLPVCWKRYSFCFLCNHAACACVSPLIIKFLLHSSYIGING